MLPLIRQAVELGADVIKCDPCDDPREFHQGKHQVNAASVCVCVSVVSVCYVCVCACVRV